MHAPIEQLLNLRDGAPVDAAVQTHVSHCRHCTESLTSLVSMRERLQALPPLTSTPRAWAAVRASVADRKADERGRRVLARSALAASLAIFAIATAWRLHAPAVVVAGVTMPSRQEAQLALAADRLEQLRSQSQALEELLAELPEQPAIERAGTAMPIDTLEAQVQWVDHQLLLNADRLRPDAAEHLWHERVEAMNSLVRLRYADAQRVAM